MWKKYKKKREVVLQLATPIVFRSYSYIVQIEINNGGETMENVTVKINAPDYESKIRHKKIFQEFEGLNCGEYMELTNDHDPIPLYYQFLFEREGQFSWEYVEKGPEQWKVIIGKN